MLGNGAVLRARMRALIRSLEASAEDLVPGIGIPTSVEVEGGEHEGLPRGIRVAGSSGHGPESEHVVERTVEFGYADGWIRRVVLSAPPDPPREIQELGGEVIGGVALWTEIARFFSPLFGGTSPEVGPVIETGPCERRAWEPSYELVHRRTGRRSVHRGEDFSADEFAVARTIDHDHCGRCMSPLSASSEHWNEGGYRPEEGWFCLPCLELSGLLPD